MLTKEELEVITLTADLANAFAKLPIFHNSDGADVCNAIHVIQNIVMSRDAVRNHPEIFRNNTR